MKTYLGDGIYYEVDLKTRGITLYKGNGVTQFIFPMDEYVTDNLRSMLTTGILEHPNAGTGQPPV